MLPLKKTWQTNLSCVCYHITRTLNILEKEFKQCQVLISPYLGSTFVWVYISLDLILLSCANHASTILLELHALYRMLDNIILFWINIHVSPWTLSLLSTSPSLYLQFSFSWLDIVPTVFVAKMFGMDFRICSMWGKTRNALKAIKKPLRVGASFLNSMHTKKN